MVRFVVLVALAAGCRTTETFACLSSAQCRLGTAVGTCEPTGFCSFSDATCDSGRRYDPSAGELANACVGSGDGGVVDDDPDHDGIPTASDNCPTVFNPTQDNEDGDAFGDACDPCPIFPDVDPPDDPDHDGVSGACDPDPINPNHIALFEGFHAGIPTSAGWTAAGLTAANDSVGFSAVTGTASLTITLPITQPTNIYTAFQMSDLGNSSGTVGLIAHVVECGLTEAAPLTQQQLVLSKGSVLASTMFAFVTGRYELMQSVVPGTQLWTCRVEHGMAPVTVTANKPFGFSQEVGLQSTGSITGAFEYLMIVTQP